MAANAVAQAAGDDSAVRENRPHAAGQGTAKRPTAARHLTFVLDSTHDEDDRAASAGALNTSREALLTRDRAARPDRESGRSPALTEFPRYIGTLHGNIQHQPGFRLWYGLMIALVVASGTSALAGYLAFGQQWWVQGTTYISGKAQLVVMATRTAFQMQGALTIILLAIAQVPWLSLPHRVLFPYCCFAIAAACVPLSYAGFLAQGDYRADMTAAWHELVVEAPNLMCKVQRDLQCTGWSAPCMYMPSPGDRHNSSAPMTLAPPPTTAPPGQAQPLRPNAPWALDSSNELLFCPYTYSAVATVGCQEVVRRNAERIGVIAGCTCGYFLGMHILAIMVSLVWHRWYLSALRRSGIEHPQDNFTPPVLLSISAMAADPSVAGRALAATTRREEGQGVAEASSVGAGGAVRNPRTPKTPGGQHGASDSALIIRQPPETSRWDDDKEKDAPDADNDLLGASG
jgi:hypothetical protein